MSVCQREKISACHWVVYSEILIDAPAEQIWSVLMDSANLSRWSTSYQGMQGDLRKGGKVVVDFVLFGKTQKLKHTLSDFEEGRMFGWSDPFLPGLRDHHVYLLKPVSEQQTRFIQKDAAKGPTALVLGGYAAKVMCDLYTDFNQKLKQAVEALAG